jgi:hypothetical protein
VADGRWLMDRDRAPAARGAGAVALTEVLALAGVGVCWALGPFAGLAAAASPFGFWLRNAEVLWAVGCGLRAVAGCGCGSGATRPAAGAGGYGTGSWGRAVCLRVDLQCSGAEL